MNPDRYAGDVTPPPFVSYAQNLEDVVLSRLLTAAPHGRFIDVGAGHPVHGNVMHGLYMHGWRGINVEPMPVEAELLRAMRPHDETIQAAVGAATGSITLFEAPPENRGATTSSADLADRYHAQGQQFVAFESPLITLSSLLARFQPGSVHVVKIDVEGMEHDVLAGADLHQHRPWVLVIEATEPNSTTTSAHRWEHLVLEAGYQCTLFDGLNRFYVRADLIDVASLLSLPANVFDNWVPALALDLAEAQRAFGDLQQYVAALLREMATLQASHRDAEEYARSLLASNELLQASAAESATYASSLEQELAKQRAAHSPDTSGSCR